jgi:RNA ligase
MTHPARIMDFDTLIMGLAACVESGSVTRSKHRELDLSLYCYSKSCVYDKMWCQFSEMARGLIVDESGRQIVATPFPKFFNVSERSDTIPDLPFEVFEKLDGSLIILFWYQGEWRAATKGSFHSEQAVWAKEWTEKHDLCALNPGTTYLCEAIYPQNRIVVQYGHTALVLLAAYGADGTEYDYEALRQVGQVMAWPVAKRFPIAAISELLASAKTLPANEEGWVLRFSNGHRLKVKGEEYMRLHRMISRLTPLSVWEAMMAGDDLVTFRRDLPEEFWADFDSMVTLIGNQARKIAADTKDALEFASNGQDLTDKDVGLMLDKFPAHVRSFVFPYRNQKGDLMQGRSRATLYRAIRPTGNRLEGYEPSSSVVRVFEEMTG